MITSTVYPYFDTLIELWSLIGLFELNAVYYEFTCLDPSVKQKIFQLLQP